MRQALDLDPHNAAAYHALGLLPIRQQRLPEALTALAEAAEWHGYHPTGAAFQNTPRRDSAGH